MYKFHADCSWTDFFARTMDFAFLLDGEPIVMPRGYQWSLQLGDRSPIPMALLERANS